MIKHQSKLYS